MSFEGQARPIQAYRVQRLSEPVRAPDIAELETLVVCAAEGTLVATAARLGISRPAVAKRVRNLEAITGTPVLQRSGRGVRLTDAGATLLAGARRTLEERDLLMSLVAEIRGEGPSAIAGLRELLGHSPQASRAAQQPEARLVETERVLELVLRSSATGVVISNPDTAVVYEVNDAFCRFTGRTRTELLSEVATEGGSWYDLSDRDRMIDQIRSSGAAERIVVRARHRDGTVRVGEATAHFIALAGTRQMLTTVDDVTAQRVLKAERNGSLIAYRALTQLAALMFAGRSLLESVGNILPELRLTTHFQTALLWDLASGQPVLVDGDPPPSGLDQELPRAQHLPGDMVTRFESVNLTSGTLVGWAVPLASIDHSVVLLAAGSPPASTQALMADVLADLATLASSVH
jgi:PAS domain S-box-containing protein